jgi:hypothetical protein
MLFVSRFHESGHLLQIALFAALGRQSYVKAAVAKMRPFRCFVKYDGFEETK